VVVEVKFNEWTSDGKLRQPVFLGFRDDKDAREVVREGDPAGDEPEVARPSRGGRAEPLPAARFRPVLKRLETIAASDSHGGVLQTGDAALEITNLDKVFFPDAGTTKGELLGYYTRMAAFILPWMRDRPLVLRRYPDGIAGKAFYQQSAPSGVPEGVGVERVMVCSVAKPRLVGGDLATLLYSVQVGAVSYDPWHSRVGQLSSADYSIVDLDPGPGVAFETVVEVALRVKEEMDGLGLRGAVKTSGSSGLHIYLPLPPDTPLEAATLVAQILSTRVARRNPKIATIERMTKRRPRGTVYVDYLQNLLGKTVAGVYAVRAKPHATVSTPLRWEELTDRLAIEAFTIDTVPERVAKEGDLWAAAMSEPNSLEAMIREGAA
jgi:bifunctional non-homologous end joining protein LigD